MGKRLNKVKPRKGKHLIEWADSDDTVAFLLLKMHPENMIPLENVRSPLQLEKPRTGNRPGRWEKGSYHGK